MTKSSFFTGKLSELPDNGVFVFGANTEGRHGKGAAKMAKDKFGAIYGQSFGRQGQSFAIITKDLTQKKHPSISRDKIVSQILYLYLYATQYPELDFYIAYSGLGKNLNGYTNREMAAMFHIKGLKIPDNIIFEENFYKFILTGQNWLAETKVVNIKKEPYDVYIGRAGKGQDGYFGNPFKLEKGKPRGSTLEKYKEYFHKKMLNDPEFKKRILSLKGKTLGCFCKPNACHGDIIKEYLDENTH